MLSAYVMGLVQKPLLSLGKGGNATKKYFFEKINSIWNT